MDQMRHARLDTLSGEKPCFLGMKIEGHLDGLLFEASVEQGFCNPGPEALEVFYTFPLPARAVILDVSVQLGERRLQGKVLPKSKAVTHYQDALCDGDAAILLEQNNDHSFCLNLGNLAPAERCTIHLRYAQFLSFE